MLKHCLPRFLPLGVLHVESKSENRNEIIHSPLTEIESIDPNDVYRQINYIVCIEPGACRRRARPPRTRRASWRRARCSAGWGWWRCWPCSRPPSPRSGLPLLDISNRNLQFIWHNTEKSEYIFIRYFIIRVIAFNQKTLLLHIFGCIWQRGRCQNYL